MLGKIISAEAGRRIAQRFEGRDAGLAGAVIGAAAPMVIARVVGRRMGPLGWIALAAGGYAVKRYMDKRPAPTAPTVA